MVLIKPSSFVYRTFIASVFQTERKVAVEVKTGGTAVGIAYWFTLHLYGDITISTYQPEIVRKIQSLVYVNKCSHPPPHTHTQNTNHWHQCVFLLPEDVTVSAGQLVTLRTLLRDSYLDITMATE